MQIESRNRLAPSDVDLGTYKSEDKFHTADSACVWVQSPRCCLHLINQPLTEAVHRFLDQPSLPRDSGALVNQIEASAGLGRGLLFFDSDAKTRCKPIAGGLVAACCCFRLSFQVHEECHPRTLPDTFATLLAANFSSHTIPRTSA